MDTEVPDIGVNTLRPTRYEPPPQPEAVEENMTSWYDWLVSHVPETIRRPVKRPELCLLRFLLILGIFI